MSFEQKYPNLFTPLYVKNAKTPFKNRIMSAPNGLYESYGLDTGKRLNQYGQEYFTELARGGMATIMLTLRFTTDPDDRTHLLIEPGNINNEGNHSAMHLLQRSVHAYQTKSMIELFHAGRCASVMANGKKIPLLASTDGEYQGLPVKGLDEQDMQDIIERYVTLAKNARRSGFDGILLHFGHGWLVHDFLSPLSNQRTDEYGGTVENRVRFPLRILRAIREVVGDTMIIELRLNGWDGVPGGITPEDAALQVLLMQKYVDMVHITCGTRLDNRTRAMEHPTYVGTKLHNAWASEIIKNTPGVEIPIGVVGYISTPEEAEGLIASGKADYICLARAIIADPEWAKKAKENRAEDIRPCLRCVYCLDHGRRKALFSNKELSLAAEPTNDGACVVNPFSHQGISKKWFPKPERIKNIAVVGGGPAGLNAAIAAGERGHKVTLYERGREFGGQIRFTDQVSFKRELKEYHEYLERRVRQCENITIKLNTAATPEMIRESNVDTAIIAVGAKAKSPDMPVTGKCSQSLGAFHNPERFGRKVVIVGGGHVGIELALHLAEYNRAVTVVEKNDFILATCQFSLRVALLQETERRSIEVIPSTEAIEILEEGVKVVNSEKGEYIILADSIIFAIGTEPLVMQRDSFLGAAPDVINVGDCMGDGVMDLPHAVETGFNAGYIQ